MRRIAVSACFGASARSWRLIDSPPVHEHGRDIQIVGTDDDAVYTIPAWIHSALARELPPDSLRCTYDPTASSPNHSPSRPSTTPDKLSCVSLVQERGQEQLAETQEIVELAPAGSAGGAPRGREDRLGDERQFRHRQARLVKAMERNEKS